MTTTLSPAVSSVSPRGMKKVSPRLTAAISVPGGNGRPASGLPSSGEPGSRRYSSSRTAPPANSSASIAPGIATTRSMSSASCASGQMTRLMPNSLRLSCAPVFCRKSSRETKQIVCGEPSWLAMPQATMLTSSRPVQAMKTSARSVPAWPSTSADVALPTTISTSSFSRRSVAAGEMSMTVTSCRADSACARP